MAVHILEINVGGLTSQKGWKQTCSQLHDTPQHYIIPFITTTIDREISKNKISNMNLIAVFLKT